MVVGVERPPIFRNRLGHSKFPAGRKIVFDDRQRRKSSSGQEVGTAAQFLETFIRISITSYPLLHFPLSEAYSTVVCIYRFFFFFLRLHLGKLTFFHPLPKTAFLYNRDALCFPFLDYNYIFMTLILISSQIFVSSSRLFLHKGTLK